MAHPVLILTGVGSRLVLMNTVETIASLLSLSEKQVQSALDLMEEGGTIPFIARYRKEQTGSLDEDQLRAIEQTFKYQTALNARKETILNALKEKGVLNAELEQSVQDASTQAALEEIYRPYKEKRKTKASLAMEAGFGETADKLWNQSIDPASLDDEAREQAGYILAERIANTPSIRQMVREWIEKHESITSTLKKDAQDEQGVYQTYYEFSNPIASMPEHRTLALDRAEKEKVLTVTITSDNEKLENMIARTVIHKPLGREYLIEVIHDALIRLILPSVKREIRAELRTKAHDTAIAGFSSNLEHLLMARPLKGQVLLSWDPGYVNGCKLAVLSKEGALLDTCVVYPFKHGSDIKPDSRFYQDAVKKTRELIHKYHPTLIVIGNGTASRESIDLISELIRDFPEISYIIGSEAGASVYSASELAKEEFPDLPVEERSAISIGRRVQDPLSELVKIDPQSLGIGMYQHDVAQKQLKEALDFVTDKAVNRVGVNVNIASPSLLRHVAGLKKPQITKILKAREKHPFTDRSELSDLLSETVFEQSIGFLRIIDGSNPLDNTGIHPESYDLTNRLLERAHLSLDDLRTDAFKKKLASLDPVRLANELGSDRYTVADILTELSNPGLDPRESLDGPILLKGVLHLEDLQPGMKLEGTVRNVTSFGAFVDIGLHEDGLVHISQLADHFVSDPASVVHTGQVVTVRVLEVDIPRKRIALSMRDENARVQKRADRQNKNENRNERKDENRGNGRRRNRRPNRQERTDRS